MDKSVSYLTRLWCASKVMSNQNTIFDLIFDKDQMCSKSNFSCRDSCWWVCFIYRGAIGHTLADMVAVSTIWAAPFPVLSYVRTLEANETTYLFLEYVSPFVNVCNNTVYWSMVLLKKGALKILCPSGVKSVTEVIGEGFGGCFALILLRGCRGSCCHRITAFSGFNVCLKYFQQCIKALICFIKLPANY